MACFIEQSDGCTRPYIARVLNGISYESVLDQQVEKNVEFIGRIHVEGILKLKT